MAKIDINMPDYFELEMLLFVIYRGSSNDTIEFLHKVSPILPFKHGKSRVLNKMKTLIKRLKFTSKA